MQKHQEAYTLWRNLFFNLRNEKTIYKVIDDCQAWWGTNCLYLTEDARASFHSAFFLAGEFRNLSKSDPKAIKEWHFKIKEAGDKILKAVNLPSLGEDETKKVVTKTEL